MLRYSVVIIPWHLAGREETRKQREGLQGLLGKLAWDENPIGLTYSLAFIQV